MEHVVLRFLVLCAVMVVTATVTAAELRENHQPSDEPSSLLFRAIVRGENQNQTIQAGENISVEIEVKNEGPGEVSGIEVLINGTPELVEKLPGALPIGSLMPGEERHLSVQGKAGAIKNPIRAELTLMLRSSSSLARIPLVKKFPVALKPESGSDENPESIDVDAVPTGSGKLKQPHAIGIAIGIGRYRDNAVSRVKYAVQDAEVVAKYWSLLGGIPPERVRQLVDGHALKSDLAEAFEDWLPKHVNQATVVYVYFSGRVVIEPDTGDVSLVPFDASGTTGSRLYSLKRVQDILARLPIQRAIIMLDISIEHAQPSVKTNQTVLFWDREREGQDKIMWMVGNRAVQEAHMFEPARHGLFTFQLLQGLGGAADLDKNGTVIAGELCTYTKGRVAMMAKEVFGNEQEPFCMPDVGQEALVRGQAMASFE